MNLSEFKQLTAQHQVLVYAAGIAVGRYETKGIIAECRQVDDFYIECEVHLYNNCNCILYCHRNTALLDKYFNHLPSLTMEELIA